MRKLNVGVCSATPCNNIQMMIKQLATFVHIFNASIVPVTCGGSTAKYPDAERVIGFAVAS